LKVENIEPNVNSKSGFSNASEVHNGTFVDSKDSFNAATLTRGKPSESMSEMIRQIDFVPGSSFDAANINICRGPYEDRARLSSDHNSDFSEMTTALFEECYETSA